MNLDPKRLERQRQVVRRFWATGGKGSFLAATGFGKSLVGVMAMLMFRKKYPDVPIIVCVPSDYLRAQWRVLVKEHKLTNVYVNTVHTLIKHRTYAGLLILDEMHSYSSPVFSGIFQSVSYNFILGMTATMNEDEERDLILHEKCPVFDEITLKECLNEGWVSPFVVYNYGIVLNEDDQMYYDDLSGKFNKFASTFGHNLTEMFRCLNDSDYRKEFAKERKWPPERIIIHAKNAVSNMKLRKDFLYNHPEILNTAEAIIKTHGKGKKIITFSQSADFCDALTDRLGYEHARSYHTRMKSQEIEGKKYAGKKLKDKVLELFKKDEIQVINTAKALDQGVDIPHIDMSLVCSGTSSVRQSIQRTGRNIRYVKGKRACEINIFIKDTQSEKWLRKRQRKHPRSTIRYILNINEIAP